MSTSSSSSLSWTSSHSPSSASASDDASDFAKATRRQNRTDSGAGIGYGHVWYDRDSNPDVVVDLYDHNWSGSSGGGGWPQIDDLPDEILLQILLHVTSPGTVGSLAMTSRRWRRLAFDNAVWEELASDADRALMVSEGYPTLRAAVTHAYEERMCEHVCRSYYNIRRKFAPTWARTLAWRRKYYALPMETVRRREEDTVCKHCLTCSCSCLVDPLTWREVGRVRERERLFLATTAIALACAVTLSAVLVPLHVDVFAAAPGAMMVTLLPVVLLLLIVCCGGTWVFKAYMNTARPIYLLCPLTHCLGAAVFVGLAVAKSAEAIDVPWRVAILPLLVSLGVAELFLMGVVGWAEETSRPNRARECGCYWPSIACAAILPLLAVMSFMVALCLDDAAPFSYSVALAPLWLVLVVGIVAMAVFFWQRFRRLGLVSRIVRVGSVVSLVGLPLSLFCVLAAKVADGAPLSIWTPFALFYVLLFCSLPLTWQCYINQRRGSGRCF